MAFACIHIPDFPVQAVVRCEPELRGRALALIDGIPPLCRVVAANEISIAAGIEIGMTEAEARLGGRMRAGQPGSGVEIRRRSPEQECNAHAALLDLCASFSPHMEDTAPATILLDLSGLDALFGDLESVAHRLARGAQDTCGLIARVAVAPNPDAALHAGRGFSGITVIAEGEEAARLGPLPVAALGASAETIETLDRWGVRNCAALAALPVLELSERLGGEGVRLHQWARGAGQRSLRLAEPEVCFEEAMQLDYDVEELEPLAFLLSRLLEALCARLAARALAASALRLRLKLTPVRSGIAPGEYEKRLNLPTPLRDVKLLLNLLRLQLQGDPPGAPIRGVFLTAEPSPPRTTQGGLFVSAGPDPEKLELTLAKLSHLVGQSRVGSPELVDTHRPDAFRMQRFVPTATGKPAMRDRPDYCSGFRIFRPALPAQVETNAGRPALVFFHGLRGTVLAASGPWRSSGGWWEKDFWRQEEWELEIAFSIRVSRGHAKQREAPRGLYRFAYDDIRRVWLVRGVFD
jgi:protein ImuB